MTVSSKPAADGKAPPAGARTGSPYTRFIPREELGDFASWRPSHFGGVSDSAGATAASAAAGATAAGGEAGTARVAAARQTGYQEGYRDGLVALESFKQGYAQQATAQVGALLEAFERQLGEIDRAAAQAVAATAVQLARQVLRSELQQRPELVSHVAAEAVHAVMMSARRIAVQVHPLDLPLVAEGAADALQARGARLQANAAVERGGVIVHSDVGSIDARLARRWAQAVAALGSSAPLDDGDEEPAP